MREKLKYFKEDEKVESRILFCVFEKGFFFVMEVGLICILVQISLNLNFRVLIKGFVCFRSKFFN